ncbi:hypothetical protein [Bacillus amyloliquefaciens]|uniref:hypothetical protein n=1 Tax=Bacillus amyloliquefaciens TaxID=1390 RepID=UPI001D02A7A3|nr:hypothetical protein [Bacillus amyloliquefaciens]MCB5334935.1 hypothetical protein [Bacillus amyloliquefaciens]
MKMKKALAGSALSLALLCSAALLLPQVLLIHLLQKAKRRKYLLWRRSYLMVMALIILLQFTGMESPII